jgi:sucrose-6F-phosphate phosphohydrolase
MKQPERWLFVSDVDDTLLGDDSGLVALAEALQTASESLITAYNSSRPCASLRTTLTETRHLPVPDYLIGALGTEIQEGASGNWIADYPQHLNDGWQRDLICEMVEPFQLAAHPAEFQTPFKVSYDVPDEAVYQRVRGRLEASGIPARTIFSGGRHLDIIPASGGKGNVIRYLAEKVGVQPERVIVAGDSGNDVDMFVAPFKGIVVANADSALKGLAGEHIYHAQFSHARGVLEGLHFWGALP